jgi:hypothetical protein
MNVVPSFRIELFEECRAKVDLWIEWYKSQKEIHDSVTGKGN